MSCRNRREISPFFSDGLAESVLPFLSFHAVSIGHTCQANLEIWESFQSSNKNCTLSSEITGPESPGSGASNVAVHRKTNNRGDKSESSANAANLLFRGEAVSTPGREEKKEYDTNMRLAGRDL